MLIDLLDGPGPLPGGGVRIEGGVGRQGHGVEGGLGGQLVLPVAVFPVLRVLGHHHQGPDLSVQPHQRQCHVLLLAPLPQPLWGALVDVRKAQKEGMGPHAPQPQAVDALVGPLPAGEGHVDHGAGKAPLPAVEGIDAPQEHPLVVGMGGHQQKIHLVRGRRRVGYVIGHGPGAEDGGLGDPQMVRQGEELDRPAARLQGKGQRQGVGPQRPDPKGQPPGVLLHQDEGGFRLGQPQHQ